MKNRGLEIFDFKEEDELPELAAGKFSRKLKSPSFESNGVLNYEFLTCVAQGTNVQRKESGSVASENIDAVKCDQSSYDAISYTALRLAGEEFSVKDGNLGFDVVQQSNLTSDEQYPYVRLDDHKSRSAPTPSELGKRDLSHGASSPGKSQSNRAISESPSTGEPVDAISDADESKYESSPSSSASDIAYDVSLNGHATDHCFGDFEMDDTNREVIIYPEYVVYRDNYWTGSTVTFYDSCLRMVGMTSHENQGASSFEWGIDDIVDMDVQCSRRAGILVVKLHVISKGALQVQADNLQGIAGIEELRFGVADPNWPMKQEKIVSLNVKYLALWAAVTDEDIRTNGDDLLRQRHYFPSFEQHFEDVVYPKGDPDAVSISKRDVDLLQPETFINDTIIDFYIKYLKNQIQPEEKNRFHFFNSFFFRKLADMDKDPSSASDGRAAFLRVRKWTRKVDLFEKDYIFIPVNFNLHWSLIVICHAREVATFEDEDTHNSLKIPCILHMDSIKGSHSGLKNLVQSYLWEEWKERQKETSEDIALKFSNLRFVPLELPQQENSFDCGLFLLHYLELFLEEAPVHFNPFKITKLSNFLNVDWFLPAEASLKRTLIQKLIFELLENRSREISSAACSDEQRSTKFPDNNENEIDVELFSERCNSAATACHGNLSSSQTDHGIEMTLLAASSMRSSECLPDSDLVLREFFEPQATAGSLLGQYQSFDETSSYCHVKSAMSPIEEEAETEDHFVYLPSGETGFQQMVGIATQACAIPYLCEGFGAETAWNPGISEQAEHENLNSSPEKSIGDSDDSSDVGIVENSPVGENVYLTEEEKTDQQRSPLVENVDCLTERLEGEKTDQQRSPPVENVDGQTERLEEEKTNQQRSPSVENVDGLTESLVSTSADMMESSAIEDSQDPVKMHDGNENGDALPSSLEILVTPSHQDSDMVAKRLHQESGMEENRSHQDFDVVKDRPHQDADMVETRDVLSDDVQMIGDDPVPESEGPPAAKRLRLTPSPNEENSGPTGSVSEDLHL